VAFIARHNPVAMIPVAILFGGFGAAGSLLQRRLGLPDASVLVLQGIAFVLILASEALRDVDWKAAPGEARAFGGGAHPSPPPEGEGGSHFMTADQALIFFAGILGGALRVGAPFLFVSLGECLTEKSGRINLGLEGVLVLSAMSAFGASWLSGSPWIGVLAAAATGALLATLHGVLCSLPRVSDVATGIALMLLGMGLAFYLGKPLIQPQAPQLPGDRAGQLERFVRRAIGPAGQRAGADRLGHRGALVVGLRQHARRLLVRMAGDSANATRASAIRCPASASPPPRRAA
jgi:ABC-type uncharacterized transport system permease subunit